MPVHRPSKERSIVFAVPEELKQWVLRTKVDLEQEELPNTMLSVLAVDDNEIQC